MNKKRSDEALHYHAKGRPGKIEVIPTKETANQRDLSLAYSPGVADPCIAIHERKEEVFTYTAKGNLVAVISNGTAVLGLGDIGPEAAKPVMEGKGLLFKIYADIDCFDLELNTKDVDELVRTVKILEPTFGGVNLEDISAPACFEIEERLKAELDIPVMHDDQHGTAIISAAALINALDLVGKKIEAVSIIVNGAGAASISCARLYMSLGATKEHIFMFDSKGLIHPSRDHLSGKKSEFTNDHLPADTDLSAAMKGADVFIGLSKGDVLSQADVKSMAKDCIVFAMANPYPEIGYEEATQARKDIIMATGRSDYPNQVNNVLGFPYIFRGALDVRAKEINEEMKMAAVQALARLAKEPVPDMVNLAYSHSNLVFGKDYIIPKPVDPRLITAVAPAVARAAMDSGVATHPIKDWDAYEVQLSKRLGLDNSLTRALLRRAKQDPKRVVFVDAEDVSVLKAAQVVVEEGIAIPILLGREEKILPLLEEHNIQLNGVEVFHPGFPKTDELIAQRKAYAQSYFELRQRKGVTWREAGSTIRRRSYFGAMMVRKGHADAMIGGLTHHYPDTIRPALQIVGARPDVKKVSGMYILMSKFGPIFLADTTVNLDPSVEDLVEITELAAEQVNRFNITPRIALVTYSNFGSVPDAPTAKKMRLAVKELHTRHPDLIVDGEMQAHMPFRPDLITRDHPFSKLASEGEANTLIFPNLSSSNIAYNLVKEIANIEKIGPILIGLNKPVHILQLNASVREIIDMVALAVVDAQKSKGPK
ncbi:MAG: NADP-dependent malic enzyme [Saprospiraceae bacterium]|nr:NADP-dependent malic enzyme [Saprospiraceae bacterium]